MPEDLSQFRYTRFVVVTHPRSGSTMLCTALGSHDEVRMYGEVFNHDVSTRRDDFPADDRRWNAELDQFQVARGARPYRDREDGRTFLEEAVFYPRWGTVPRAVGIKLFYNQALSVHASSAWQLIENDRQIRIIHLVRTDVLAAWVSLLLAQQTGVWAKDFGTSREPGYPREPFLGDVDAFLSFARMVVMGRRSTRQLAATHRFVEICYEQALHHDCEATFCKLLAFLDVPHSTLRPATRQQRAYSLPAILLNYSELRDAELAAITEPGPNEP